MSRREFIDKSFADGRTGYDIRSSSAVAGKATSQLHDTTSDSLAFGMARIFGSMNLPITKATIAAILFGAHEVAGNNRLQLGLDRLFAEEEIDPHPDPWEVLAEIAEKKIGLTNNATGETEWISTVEANIAIRALVQAGLYQGEDPNAE